MQRKTITFFAPVYDDHMKRGRPSRIEKTDFAMHLAQLREAAGLSQRQVAVKLGIAQSSYANWERFDVPLKPHQLVDLAGVLGITVDELLNDQQKKRRGGPTGKMRQIFETASQLPRSQQKKIVEFVEPFISQAVRS